MTCHHLELPDGSRAIVCMPRGKRCGCGRPANLACDWKVPTRRSGTCDKPICTRCTTSPAPGKDICQAHAPDLRQWEQRQRASETLPDRRLNA